LKVVLYTKTDCGLCAEAEDLLRSVQQSIRFELELVYIEEDESLLESYQDRVPVIAVDGREVASAPLSERAVRAAISA
jgi:glutaredoxin